MLTCGMLPDVRKVPLSLSERGRKAGQARLRTMTPEERRKVARLAARARWKRISKAERSEAMRKAVLARWARVKAAKVKT